MAGITGMGTTFNLPNYHGELFALTPVDTPLLSMAGGIGGGKQATSTEYEWQTYDLRDPEVRTRLEGADAPTAEERVRANVKNVVQIFQEKVSTSYTKQAAIGQLATTQAAPFHTYDGLGVGNPVTNEHTWQVAQALKQIARDVNFAFWHAEKNVPTDNSTARQTAGLLSVLTTNKTFGAPEVTAASATDTITFTAHGLSNGDQVVFTDVDAATNIRVDRSYFVVNSAANTFKVRRSYGRWRRPAHVAATARLPRRYGSPGRGSVRRRRTPRRCVPASALLTTATLAVPPLQIPAGPTGQFEADRAAWQSDRHGRTPVDRHRDNQARPSDRANPHCHTAVHPRPPAATRVRGPRRLRELRRWVGDLRTDPGASTRRRLGAAARRPVAAPSDPYPLTSRPPGRADHPARMPSRPFGRGALRPTPAPPDVPPPRWRRCTPRRPQN